MDIEQRKQEERLKKVDEKVLPSKLVTSTASANTIKYVWQDGMLGVLDEGSSYTITGTRWLDEYMRENTLGWSDMEAGTSYQTFRFGSEPMIHRTPKTVNLLLNV